MNNKKLFVIYRNSDILRNIKLTEINKTVLRGGGNRKLKVEYENNIYIFEELELSDGYFILFSQNEEYECVTIVISPDDNIAEIHGIGNYEGCLMNTNTNIGSHLLKITLKMLKKYAKRLNINKISLKDNSVKKCGNNAIQLCKMMILLTGHTWYGKYGFRPRHNIKNEIDKYKNDKYMNNVKIISKITIKDIDILKYIKMTKKDSLIMQTEDALKNNPDMLLKDFLSRLLEKYDKTCKYFNIFYEKLYNDIGLTDFQGGSFIIEI